MMNRVSMVAIKDVLNKYLAAELVNDIMNDVESASIDEANAVVGMSVREYFDRFDDTAKVVWAADSDGFGKAGDPVYGNLDGLKIYGVVGLPGRGKVSLMVWWDWKEWKDANKRFVVTTPDGVKKGYYAKHWEAAAELAIADGLTDFTVSRWMGVSPDGGDLTNRVGSVTCGKINKGHIPGIPHSAFR